MMNNLGSYITINPEVRFGKPCIKDTRIAVTDILQWMASGMTHEEILNDYPVLQEYHIRAALSFAADRESFIKIIPVYANFTFA
ncbi:MAG: DUF433 domain-containing protein [Tannerella sp.]|jgi:uncharacterized protein (DUF433 family)|nr:DUF433 domain-containing protein [Tannerella sp.]